MKKSILLLLTVVAATILIGCSNPGTIQLSWQNAGSRGLSGRSAAAGNNIQEAKKVLISIKAADGTVAYSNKELKVYNFNGAFLSESLTLKVGSYKLTDYTVLNEAGTVIFAAPKEGSNQAQFAADPLPINFTVTKNQTTEVVPEVVDITGITPADLGYSSFSFKEIKLLNFVVTVMVKDASTDRFIPTDAVLDVTSDTRAYHYNLTAGPNPVSVNDNFSSYTLTVTKAGYLDYRVTYTSAELKEFQNNPPVITLTKNRIITFVDPGLELSVREGIKKPTGDIYTSDVVGLT